MGMKWYEITDHFASSSRPKCDNDVRRKCIKNCFYIYFEMKQSFELTEIVQFLEAKKSIISRNILFVIFFIQIRQGDDEFI